MHIANVSFKLDGLISAEGVQNRDMGASPFEQWTIIIAVSASSMSRWAK